MIADWLLVKRGLYYRPHDCGYTGIRDHAGRYTEEEARERVGNGESGVSMIRAQEAPEFSAACFEDLARRNVTVCAPKSRALLANLIDTKPPSTLRAPRF